MMMSDGKPVDWVIAAILLGVTGITRERFPLPEIGRPADMSSRPANGYVFTPGGTRGPVRSPHVQRWDISGWPSLFEVLGNRSAMDS